jgi:hypothetical protein
VTERERERGTAIWEMKNNSRRCDRHENFEEVSQRDPDKNEEEYSKIFRGKGIRNKMKRPQKPEMAKRRSEYDEQYDQRNLERGMLYVLNGKESYRNKIWQTGQFRSVEEKQTP